MVPGGGFFFTLVTESCRPMLASADVIDVLLNLFRFAFQSRPFDSDAIVVMPDHVQSGYASLTRPTGLAQVYAH